MIVLGMVLSLLIAAGITGLALSHDPSTADVGDCFSGVMNFDMKVRSCDDPNATYKVVKVSTGIPNDGANATCDGTDATDYLVENGTILCLKRL